MSKVEFRVAARCAKPRVRSVWSALLVTVGGGLSVMCSGSVDGASGDGGAGETSTEQGGASSDGGRPSGGRTAMVGGQVAAAGQSLGGATFAGGGGQGGAEAGPLRCADMLPARCLATATSEGGAPGSLQNAIAELVGVTSLNAVNNHDQIVGSRRCDSGDHAFMLDDTGVHDVLQGEDDLTSVANDINDAGTIVGGVGFELLPSGTHTMYPFIQQGGVTTVLHDLPGGRAMAVNAYDQVLIDGGYSSPGYYVWDEGVLTLVGANLAAYDINDLGQVVGGLSKGVGERVGFIWADGEITELPLLREAIAINDSGQIAGVSSTFAPALLDGASLVELGPGARKEPIAITPDGTVLGADYVYADGVVTALSARVGRNSFEEVEARGINANHVIVGHGSVLTFTHGGGGCRLETCEVWIDHAVVWKDECFGACCGDAADGAGGAGGAGGASGSTCDPVPDAVPTTCPTRDASDAYRETGLGTLEAPDTSPDESPWAISSARAINASGDVVGYATLCDQTRAILYRAGTLTELVPVPGALDAMAWDINDEGEVLGNADGVTFVWKDGVTTVLSGVGRGSGTAINNLGQVLGEDQNGAYIWDGGVVTRLGLEPHVRVTDINDSGQVTGYHELGASPAFIWEDGQITSLPPLPGDNYALAWAINEAGQVVGSSVEKGKQPRAAEHAVLWDSAVPLDITPPTDYPLVSAAGVDINESGVVVGQFQEDGPRQNSAGFVFDHGVTTRVFPEDPTVGAALVLNAINDSGQIAGTTLRWTGSPHQATVWSRDCFGACCQ